MGQLSLCSQVLLLPLGVPRMPAPACFTFSLSQDSEARRVPTITTAVGNVTQGQGVPDHRNTFGEVVGLSTSWVGAICNVFKNCERWGAHS